MCGIIGYTGSKSCLPILIEGLRTLEYRGYDSAGVTVTRDGCFTTVKARGRLSCLEEKLKGEESLTGCCGIGHTRWATHGEPSDKNSHPHETPLLSLVHNGIIENYDRIEELLREAGYSFVSDTDTERAAKLIDMFYAASGEPVTAIRRALRVIRGSFAFGIIFKDRAETVYAVRKDSPLLVAHNGEGGFIASDIPALLSHTTELYRLDEGIIAKVGKSSLEFCDLQGNPAEQELLRIDWDVEQAQKGGYPHFMLKEINEEPEAIRKTVSQRLRDGAPFFGVPALDGESLKEINEISIVACGTAMHAGLVGKAVIERLARVPVTVEIASEFRYRDPIIRKGSLVILLSQSGETADTLAALRHAKEKGAYTLAIVNVVGSSVAREADSVLYTGAGPEIAVASTKAYSVQCAMLYLIALRLAQAKEQLGESEIRELCGQLLSDVPNAVERTLEMSEEIRDVASRLVSAEHLFYIGRDLDCAICTEASLKLKEISYIHSEAYAAGEMKHGTISLITDGIPVVALVTVERICEKTLSGIREVSSRGAEVICICSSEVAEKYDVPCKKRIVLPEISELLAPFPAVTVMQLLAYHTAALKGVDVDKPRNLAKSVTVE